MWLTKNEKGVLKLLVANAKLSDTSISKELNISSQAVGRIRERLEEDIIQKYTVNLDSKMLGINIISIIKVNCNNSKDKTIEEIQNEIKKLPEVMFFLKTINGEGEHISIAGFKSMEELEKFINEKKKIKHFNDYYSIKEVIALPLNCVLKNSNVDLYNKMIDLCGTKHAEVDIK